MHNPALVDPMYEVPRTTQHEGEPPRRWFTCRSADLYVWGEDRCIDSFEFCYDKPRDEHSLRWSEVGGFQHMRIDDGESTPLANETPIAVPDGRFDLTDIAFRFEAVGAGIDPTVYRFVLKALHQGG